MTNRELVKRYLSLRINNITAKSKQAFAWDLNVFLKFLGDKQIKDVTYKDIDAFLQYCSEERKNGDQALSRKYNTLNTFFKTMIAKEYLDMKNPLDKVEKIKVREKVRGHVTIEEYKKMIEYLESIKDYRSLALFSLLFSSGIRLSEATQLNRDSFDFEDNSFIVLGKGQKEGECTFSDEAKEYILQYLDSRDDDCEALFVCEKDKEKRRITDDTIARSIKKRAVEAGITKKISTHKFRHGCAMMLLDNDLPINEIQRILRHKNISTTQIYARTSMKRVKKNVNEIYKKVF